MAFPPFPELKSFQIPLAGDTINDGERSSENGLNPLKLLPARFNCTKSPITSSTRAVSKTVSMVAFEINFYDVKCWKASKIQSKSISISMAMSKFNCNSISIDIAIEF